MTKNLDIDPGNVSIIEDIEDDAIKLATTTLSGDIADILIMHIKSLQKPYSQLDRSTQLEVVNAVRTSMQEAVTQAVQIIAGFDRHCIVAKVKKVSVKSGLEAVVVTHKNQQALLDLGMAEGGTVMIMLADESKFMGESTAASNHVDEDQKPLFDSSPLAKEKSLYENIEDEVSDYKKAWKGKQKGPYRKK